MRNQCNIITDLLPLYHDGVCSEDSREFVAEHLSQCEACRKLAEEIDREIAAPAKAEEIDALKGIKAGVRKGRKKAFFKGLQVSLIALLLLVVVYAGWWYFGSYRYYAAFAEGQSPSSEVIKHVTCYSWHDETYEYYVQVPVFPEFDGMVSMSRLDGSEELSILRWWEDGGKYTFELRLNDASTQRDLPGGPVETVKHFIVDRDLNNLGRYPEGELENRLAELDKHRGRIQQLVDDAIAAWPFLNE